MLRQCALVAKDFLHRCGRTGSGLRAAAFRVGVLIFGTSCFFFGAGSARAQSDENSDAGGERQLFVELVETRAVRPVRDASAIRQRNVAVDLEQLPKAGRGEVAPVPLNLFPDASFEGLVEKMEKRGPDRYTISGHLAEDAEASFILVREGNVIVADVFARDRGNFEVRTTSSGRYVVKQVNESSLEPCGFGPAQMAQRRPRASRPANAPAELRDAQNTIDVMVLYTSAARAAGGGSAAMQATAELFVAAANTTYQNSQISARLRLVYAGEVNYAESGSANTDLSRLTYLNDGYLEEVHALRNEYGADVVSLLVNDFDYCGIGWLNYGPTRAFSVVDFGCGSSTFVHEIGHNMGCAHDRAHASAPGEYAYSYGHRFNGQSGTQFRTVMSYAPGTRIQHFSNPAVSYDGVATGIPDGQANSADNAKTVNLTAPAMVAYRAAADMVDCNGNFQPDAADIQSGASEDCNDNEIPDECDVSSGGSDDANGNDVPDECECDASACDDGVDCTLDTCNPATGACVYTAGGIPFGDLNYNGSVDVDDVQCALYAFQNLGACPNADVVPCGGNNLIDVDDLSALLAAFNGVFVCPSSCP